MEKSYLKTAKNFRLKNGRRIRRDSTPKAVRPENYIKFFRFCQKKKQRKTEIFTLYFITIFIIDVPDPIPFLYNGDKFI